MKYREGPSIKPIALAVSLLGVALPQHATAAEAGTVRAAPVVVTATRVEQSSFDLPVSIDAVDQRQIQEDQPGVNLSEVLNRVPGVVVQNRQNYAQDLQISSRGFGARSAFGVRGIRLVADGIPATNPDGQGQAATFNLNSAARVEVLRGPYSALHGSSSGGVIQIFTEDGPAQPTATAGVLLGSYDTTKADLKFGGQSGKLNYVMDVSRFETDGYRQHSETTRDQFNGKFRYDLGDGKLTVVVNGLHQPDTGDSQGLDINQLAQDRRQAAPAALSFNTRKSIDHAQTGAIYERQLTSADELRAMAYFGNRKVVQYQSIPVAVQVPPPATDALHPGGVIDFDRDFGGAGLRLTHKSGAGATLTAGVDYDRSAERRKGFENFTGGGAVLGVKGALRRDEDDTVDSINVYAQGEWQASERWSLSAGLRHSRVNFKIEDKFIVGINPNDSGEVTHSNTSPVAGVVYHLSPEVNLYANAGKGFETPTFNELFYRPGSSGPNLGLQPSTSKNYEAGVKAFVGADTRVNAAVFRIDTKNEIVSATSLGGRSTFRNAGKTERSGLELAVDSVLGGGFTAYAAYTYLDAKFKGDTLDGKQLPGVPKQTLYGEIVWRQAASGFHTALEARASDRVQVADNNADKPAPGYGVVNWRAGFEQKAGAWRLQEFLRVDNLFDKEYVGSVIVNQANKAYYEPAPTRNYMIGFNASHRF